MMRGPRRLVVVAMAGVLAAGALTASLELARADSFVQLCGANQANGYECSLDGTIASPGSISVSVTSGATSEGVDVSWTVTCADSSGSRSQSGGTVGPTPLDEPLAPLPPTADGQCTVNTKVSLAANDTVKVAYTGELEYTPASASPTPTATPAPTAGPVHPVKGYAGKCVDDNRNSSANRAKVQIWTCSGSDQAESWTYSHNQLVHNGKCLNDQYAGGSGSHVILYTCNGASNEHWTELANGELVLKAHGGTLCLDDPAYSTRNGTQLIVYTCKDSSNQRWSLP